MDSIPHWHCEKPGAVLGIGVLVGEARRVNCTILGGDVPSTRHCRESERNTNLMKKYRPKQKLFKSLYFPCFFFILDKKIPEDPAPET